MDQNDVDSAAIIRNEHGEVSLDGCLIFHSKPAAFAFSAENSEGFPILYITNNTFYSVVPRWWSLIGWYRMIRIIQQSCTRREGDDPGVFVSELPRTAPNAPDQLGGASPAQLHPLVGRIQDQPNTTKQEE